MPSTREQIEFWKAQLLDLSRRNRLLHVPAGQSGTIALVHPAIEPLFDALVRHRRRMPFAAPLSLEQRLDALRWDQPATGATVRLDRVAAPPPKAGELGSDLPPEVQERVLYNLRLKARNALTEQGVNLLFVALGFLEWFDPQTPEEVWRSPLLLVPVEIQRAPGGAEYAVRMIDDEIVLNPTLAHKMRHDFGIRLPDLPIDSDDLQLEAVFAQITALVEERFGWRVVPEATLGLFSFLKLLMYNDLRRAAVVAEGHPILRMLAGEESRKQETGDTGQEAGDSGLGAAVSPPGPALDSRSPEECFQVLDADASQAEAIAAARAGVSFVLQGPPGTGKSQTIANIIAECLAQGKRVLFVSEKMAALEVVYNRLRDCGLGEFCLELHSHKASKRAVLDALGATLDAALASTPPRFPYAELSAARDQLNSYASALHTPVGALGWSAYTVHGRVAALTDAPDYDGPLVDILTCTPEQMGAIDTLLAKLDARRELLGALPTNPWRGSTSSVSSFEQRGRIRTRLRALLTALAELAPVANACADELGLPQPRTVGAARTLASLGALLREDHAVPTAWLEDESWTAAGGRAALVADAHERYRALLEAEGRLFARYQPAMLALDLDGLLQRFTQHSSSWLRVLRPQYHRDLGALRETLLPGATVDATSAVDDLRLAHEVRNRQRWEADSAPILSPFAPLFAGRATDWNALAATVHWAERLLALDLPRPQPPYLQAAASAPVAERDELLAAFARLDALLARLAEEVAFVQTLFPDGDPRTQSDQWELTTGDKRQAKEDTNGSAPASSLAASPALLLEQMSGLDDWWEWSELRRGAAPAGLGPFVDALIASAEPAAAAPRRAFHKRFCQLWLDAAYGQLPALRGFQQDHHEALIERFRQLDKAQLTAARVNLRRTLAARRPSPGALGVPTSDLGTLRRELQKQRRHKPIRQLLREIPKLLGLLKPCLLMSPLSVSQFLDPESISFDLVIFDEASQIRTEDAVGAIMRGAALVVVGDNKQLPPTSFFQTTDDEPESDDENPVEPVERFESILDAAVAAGLPAQMLRWHYRSRHESLITFSNANFYNGRLATFPVATGRPEMGVSFVYVADAIYDRQGTRANVVEARQVADLICQQIKAAPERSLGVVAFSQPQQLAILHELERRRAEDESLDILFDEDRDNAFFVKNLENVQGDERQVMIVSVGYGRDKSGRLLMNFGPLNQQGGERRLNVAITRAREQVVLVSSIQPEDIDLKRTQHPGPHLLRAYMEYARRGGPTPGGTPISPDGDPARLAGSQRLPAAVIAARFEDDLATALAQHGLQLHRQVGHSDFRIDIAICDPHNPGHYLLGVECDGADYGDAPTARDRDRLREEVLGDLGWRIKRAWSASWARDAEAEIARVLGALEASGAHHAGKQATDVPKISDAASTSTG